MNTNALLDVASADLGLSSLAGRYVDRGEPIPGCLIRGMSETTAEMLALASEMGGDVSATIAWAIDTVAAFEGVPADGIH